MRGCAVDSSRSSQHNGDLFLLLSHIERLEVGFLTYLMRYTRNELRIRCEYQTVWRSISTSRQMQSTPKAISSVCMVLSLIIVRELPQTITGHVLRHSQRWLQYNLARPHPVLLEAYSKIGWNHIPHEKWISEMSIIGCFGWVL